MKRIIVIFFYVVCINIFCVECVLIEPHLIKYSELNSFFVSKTAITQELFEEIMQINPSKFVDKDNPVESISWYEAIVFCNLLSIKEGLEPVYIFTHYNQQGTKDLQEWTKFTMGNIPNHRVTLWQRFTIDEKANGYRMLSDDEWELIYETIIADITDDLEDYAWVYTNSNNTTHPVAQKKVDKLGLYDFLGNVFEWRFDHFGEISSKYYLHKTEAEADFYYSLSFKKFINNDYVVIKNAQGLYPLIRREHIGLRVCRTRLK